MCMHISQDHPVVALPYVITRGIGVMGRACKKPKQILVELTHLKGCEEVKRPFQPVTGV